MHTNLSKFISMVLRHKPHIINLTLDKNGWADVSELISKINKAGKYEINLDILEQIVRDDNKQRYSLNNGKIRANQGHTIKVDLKLKKAVPPVVLYHGTARKSLEGIRKKGILKMNRHHVHLSANEEIALKVGQRHGEAVVLVIDAKAMLKDNYDFYLSENGVWLCEDIKPKYIIKTIS